MTAEPGTSHWTAVLPLASSNLAKSRLRPASETDERHAALVWALRADTAAALQESAAIGHVVAISPDPIALAWANELGFEPLTELGHGLNQALAEAAGHALTARPTDGIMAIVGDLPTATGPAIDEVLRQLQGGERGFVADHTGQGTTLLAALGLPLDPHFGTASARAHLASGARELPAAESLRWDVDVPEDLAAALRLPGAAATRRLRGAA